VGVFKNLSFSLIWIGLSTSRLGDSLYYLASYWLIWDLTHSATTLGLTGAITALSTLIGLFSGIFVDRWDKRRTMIVSDLIRMIAVLTIPCALLFGEIHWQLIVAVLFISGVAGNFFTPAERAVLPAYVGKDALPAANSILFVSEQIALMSGAVLAGSVMIPLGVHWAFLVNALTFLFSILAISRLPKIDKDNAGNTKKSGHFLKDFKETYDFILRSAVLRLITPLLLFLFFAYSPMLVLMSKWSDDVLQQGSYGYGVLQAVFPIGMAIGGMSASKVFRRFPLKVSLPLCLLGVALAITCFSFTRTLFLSAVALTLVGACLACANVVISTFQQTVVPPEIRGRYFSTNQALISLALPVGYALSGALADVVDIAVLFLCVSACFFLGALLVVKALSSYNEEQTTSVSRIGVEE
jgi:DHA3 family macrolide efflux protein-like MFS transporter